MFRVLSWQELCSTLRNKLRLKCSRKGNDCDERVFMTETKTNCVNGTHGEASR